MTTRRWIINHRCCWITVYVSCRNAQIKYHSNHHAMYMHCHVLTICQLPSCNLFTQHVSYLLWRDTSSELWTPVILLHWLNNHKLQTVLFHSLQFNTHFPHETFNPLFSASRWDWQPHCFVGAKYFDCVVCRSTLVIVLRRASRQQPSEELLLLLVR